MRQHLPFFFGNFSVHESAQFCKSPCTFFHTKTDPQNSQEPHQINVSKKFTSKMIDGNSLPYYQEGRKGGLHPPFRSLRLLISPRFFVRPSGAFFYSVCWLWLDISNCDSSISIAGNSKSDSSIASVTSFTFSRFCTC